MVSCKPMEAPLRSPDARPTSMHGHAAARLPEGLEIRAPFVPDGEAVLTAEALAFVAKLERRFGPRRREPARPPPRGSVEARLRDGGRTSSRRPPTSAPRTGPSRQSRRTCGTAASRSPGPSTARWSSTRSTRGVGLHGRLRGLLLPHLEKRGRGPEEPDRRHRGLDRARLAGGEGLPPESPHGDAHGAPARLASRGEARPRRRRAGLGEPLRFRALLLSQRPPPPLPRNGAVPLPAEDGEPPRGAPLERRVPARTGGARPSDRHDPRHGPDRDDPRGVRDGRDPLGAARPLGGPELRALGLHLQLHQEIPEPPGLRPARPLARDDEAATSCSPTRTCSCAPATAAASTRWEAWRRRFPIKGDEQKNARAMEKVAEDKRREVAAGHDGTWVAHPGLVPLARRDLRRRDARAEPDRPPASTPSRSPRTICSGFRRAPITEAGLRQNVNVGVLYLEAWLRGSGCVPLYDLMEDAATAEISRTQVWQWLRHGAKLEDGRTITPALYAAIRDEELAAVRRQVGEDRLALRPLRARLRRSSTHSRRRRRSRTS